MWEKHFWRNLLKKNIVEGNWILFSKSVESPIKAMHSCVLLEWLLLLGIAAAGGWQMQNTCGFCVWHSMEWVCLCGCLSSLPLVHMSVGTTWSPVDFYLRSSSTSCMQSLCEGDGADTDIKHLGTESQKLQWFCDSKTESICFSENLKKSFWLPCSGLMLIHIWWSLKLIL